MKFQKDVGYGHTLDLGQGHHIVQDKETGKHVLIDHENNKEISEHNTAQGALNSARMKVKSPGKLKDETHPEYKKYLEHTALTNASKRDKK